MRHRWALESAVDELARKQGKDPVDFRLHNITTNEPRLADCLSAVKELAGDKPADVPSRTGRGFACGIYEHRCYVAVCADVSVDPETRTIQVTRLSCVQDVVWRLILIADSTG